MTVEQFKIKAPGSIDHPTHGHGVLEIVVDRKGDKGACYRHSWGGASHGTYGKTWEEVLPELKEKAKAIGSIA